MTPLQTPYAAVVGAANLDILGFSLNPLIPRDSNPGRIRFGAGGVGRNIAENLARLGARTELITALPGGPGETFVRRACESAGVGLEHALTLPGSETSAYVALMDHDGDMALAVSDMDAVARLDVPFLESRAALLDGASVIVAEANLPPESIGHLATEHAETPVLVDAVSVTKGRRLGPLIGRIHTLMMNRIEAEALCGLSLEDRADFDRAGDRLVGKGCRRIFITLGAEGVYWRTGSGSGVFRPPEMKVVNATGAGDAFTAGVAFAMMNGFPAEKTARFASAAAALALASESPVNPGLTREEAERLAGL